MTTEHLPPTILDILWKILRHPWRNLVINWNWKAALLSAFCRAVLFFAVNLPAGIAPGVRAMSTEFLFRGVASGVLGSVTQAFSRAQHYWVALVLLPALGHTAEFLVHRAAGTVRLSDSIMASVAFSILTTAFNLFAMKRGALLVGDNERPLREDLQRMPALILAFLVSGVRILTRVRREPPKRDPDNTAMVMPL